MSSLYKQCPFRRRGCTKECALYADLIEGCAFLELPKELGHIVNDLMVLKDLGRAIEERIGRRPEDED